MILLEGKTLSRQILADTALRAGGIAARRGRRPKLAIINYYPDSASAVYVRNKVSACKKAGIDTQIYVPPESDGYAGFRELVSRLGSDSGTDAIMIERPLPAGFDRPEIWDILPYRKDPDGLSTVNAGRLFTARRFSDISSGDFFAPCTALAVMRILAFYKYELKGKKIAVVGRSNIVGKPLALMLTAADATVTVCHTRTTGLAETLGNSDIIVSAAGRARMLGAELIPEGAVVIDVGTNIDEDGKMCGDVDFAGVKDRVSAVTPVPGGVGPVTKALLLEAAVRAAEMNL